MNNSYGQIFRITTFGESHGPAIGVVIDGVPAGIEIDEAVIQKDLDRRRPGQSLISTPRKEDDKVKILSGVFEGKTTGTALALVIENQDQRSRDYSNIVDIYRPGHADFTYDAKYGFRDYRGGGRSSGRETATRVAAGAVAKLLLAKAGIKIIGHTVQIGDIKATEFDESIIESNGVRCADANVARAMVDTIIAAMGDKDSVGGVIECRISGVPAGWGEPVFDKLDGELAKAIMSLGGVKGFEIGAGFAVASRRGSQNNDAPTKEGWSSNHAGGILGGISNGAEIVFRAAVKPTASISAPQHSMNRAGEEVDLSVKGRHDPCLCPRAVVVAESMAALVLADMMLRQRAIANFVE